ncbi:hypothetical protein [Aliamphritea ceti]|uniref:hypothetical protein n=1 Tax=Aliamphritea ceti TaxID=1524258 RepID=UPI0021C3355E|nr:hypothetical protein [Aliamphritea ceti]
MSQQVMISLCDKTGKMAEPWAKAGYLCYCVDVQHAPGEKRVGNIVYVGADIQNWQPPASDVAFVAAFPPCTDLAVSGARWFKDKGLKALISALSLVERCREIAELVKAPYFLENPVSTISSYWRKPDFTFNPCDFGGYLPNGGDAYTKKTCLWVGGGFVMPEFKAVEPVEGSKMHLMPPGPERANLRSATPEGFAKAVFEFNGGSL